MPSSRFLALAVAVLASTVAGSRRGDAATILVPGDYASLQAAADGASAGDVILIYRDAIAENVSLTARSDLTFVSKGKATMTSFTFNQCDRMAILGLQIEGSAAEGIRLWRSHDIVVSGVTVRNTAKDGIQVEDGGRVRIEKCRVEAVSGDGIRVGRTAGPGVDVEVVKNRIASVLQSGIVVAGSGNRFEGNAVTECGVHGVMVESGGANTFVKNKLASLDDDGFRILGGGSNVLLGNSVRDASRYGYYLGCSGNELTGNKAKGSGVFGLLDTVGGNILSRNIFGWSWTP